METATMSRLEDLYFGADPREKAELEALERLLVGVRTFVDVGAALGQYTFHADKIIKGGTLVAVEADPDRFRRLDQLTKKWSESSDNRIAAVSAAVSDAPGEISFYVNDRISGAGFIIRGTDADDPDLEWREVAVKAETLDRLLADHEPDFMKMDIEGFEYRALLGAEKILRAGKCRFLVEVHPWGDPTLGKRPEDVFALFYQRGYDFRRVHRHWLFAPSRNRAKALMKYLCIRAILRNARLKRTLKSLVLRIDALAASFRGAPQQG